jgi:hypothetical protein
MANPFDQFDQIKPATSAVKNPFDQFDTAPAQPMPGYGEDMAKGLGAGLKVGVAGAVALPRTIAELGYKGADWIAEKMGVQDRAPMGDTFDALPSYQGTLNAIVDKTGPMYEPKTTPGQYAKTVGEFAPGALFPGGAVARAANVIAPAIGAETGGQLFKGTEYENTARLVGGVAGGIVGPRAITPLPQKASVSEHVKVLEREGVPVSAGQASGRKALRWAESVADDTPLAGGRASAMQEQTGEAFTRAALRRVGEDAPRATPQVLDSAFARIGGQFDDLAQRNTMKADAGLISKVKSVADDYTNLKGESARAPIIENTLNDLRAAIQKHDGEIPGKFYQTWRSDLDKAARGARMDPPLQDALFKMRNSLDEAMGASIAPADKMAWAQARRQYRNMIVIEKAARGAGEATAQGLISPSKLRNAVEQQHGRSYVRGKGDFAELARAGEAVLKPLPQSGTGPRVAMQGGLAAMGGLMAGAPGAALGFAGQGLSARALMSSPMQRYLSNQVMQPNQLGALSYARAPIWAQLPQMNERDR